MSYFRSLLRRHAVNTLALSAIALPAADMLRRELGASDATPTPELAQVVSAAEEAVRVSGLAPGAPVPVARALTPIAEAAPAPAPAPANPVAASVDAALRELGPRVTRTSDEAALRTAFAAYYNYRAANPEEVRKPYLYFVDMGLDNLTPRGYVFDMDALDVVDGPFQVAHGHGSLNRDGVPTNFSNRPGSNATSVGLYLAQETYTFSGKSNGRRYTSVGLRMRGESGEFNDAARRRGIVAHGAPYVTASRAGKSQGCPAMEQARANRLLPLIANGGLVFIYSPHATRWLASDRWVATERLAGTL